MVDVHPPPDGMFALQFESTADRDWWWQDSLANRSQRLVSSPGAAVRRFRFTGLVPGRCYRVRDVWSGRCAEVGIADRTEQWADAHREHRAPP